MREEGEVGKRKKTVAEVAEQMTDYTLRMWAREGVSPEEIKRRLAAFDKVVKKARLRRRAR